MKKIRILTVFGTRPEAIKMAPVIKVLNNEKKIEHKSCVTFQHREMLEQALVLFDLKPDFSLDLMLPNQSLTGITCGVLEGLRNVIQKWRPHRILVHGDTTTTLSAALAAYYEQVPVGHIEAGLRTGNRYAPWPEELNRKITADIADLHFSPTAYASANLIKEGVPQENIFITGNTVIDALFQARDKLYRNKSLQDGFMSKFSCFDDRRLILVTGHRRENFSGGFERICYAIREIAKSRDVQIVYPVHLNPNVQEPVKRILSGLDNVFLIEPQEYLAFIFLMDKSYLILTDSGGVQEEAPSLGKPVLVMRDTTERPEAMEVGTIRLVGTNVDQIVGQTKKLLDDKDEYQKMNAIYNPYGSGKASISIAREICRRHAL